jgi:uncharacterized membrane protein
MAYLTGEPAEEAIENLAGVSKSLIGQHEDAATIALIATAVLGLAALMVLWRFRRGLEFPRWVSSTGLAVAIGAAVLMGWTANLGGSIRHPEIAIGSDGQPQPNEADHEDERDRPGSP